MYLLRIQKILLHVGENIDERSARTERKQGRCIPPSCLRESGEHSQPGCSLALKAVSKRCGFNVCSLATCMSLWVNEGGVSWSRTEGKEKRTPYCNRPGLLPGSVGSSCLKALFASKRNVWNANTEKMLNELHSTYHQHCTFFIITMFLGTHEERPLLCTYG